MRRRLDDALGHPDLTQARKWLLHTAGSALGFTRGPVSRNPTDVSWSGGVTQLRQLGRAGRLIEPDEANADMDVRMARQFAEQWYAAWNAHDLDAILDHYTDDVELMSPLASDLAASAGGRLVGKDALRAYFASGLARFPTLRFEPIDLLVGVESLVLRYLGPTGVETAEVVFLNTDGKVSRYLAHYAAPHRAGRIPGQDP